MEFGKLPNVDRVNFSLPEDSRRAMESLGRYSKGRPVVYVGCPAWAKKEWVGKIYPKKTQSQDYLKRYGEQYNSIELNSTHYRAPDSETVRRWASMVPEDFRFSPKFPQEISHHRGLIGTATIARSFCETIGELGSKLGVSFLQLPPGFAPQQISILQRFLQELPPGFRIAVEFRHASWFRNHELIPQALDLLESCGAYTVITDVAGRRDVLHLSLTGSVAMIRFVGNSLHSSDYSRVDEWVGKLGKWFESGLKELYFFIHEPDDVLCPDLSKVFIERMNERMGLNLRNWKPVDQEPQMNLF